MPFEKPGNTVQRIRIRFYSAYTDMLLRSWAKSGHPVHGPHLPMQLADCIRPQNIPLYENSDRYSANYNTQQHTLLLIKTSTTKGRSLVRYITVECY